MDTSAHSEANTELEYLHTNETPEKTFAGEEKLKSNSFLRRSAIEKLFKQIDTNMDGVLSKEIVRALALNRSLQDNLAAIPGLGEHLKPSKLRAAIKSMNIDKHNAISLEEWVDYVEDVVDTSMLMKAFETAAATSKLTRSTASHDDDKDLKIVAPLDVLLDNFDCTIVGASSPEILRKQITQTVGHMNGAEKFSYLKTIGLMLHFQL